MWKDLSMQQRADLMDIYLSHGISSLDEMRKHYNSRNQFAEGGNLFSGENTLTQQTKRPVTTGGAGYVPTISQNFINDAIFNISRNIMRIGRGNATYDRNYDGSYTTEPHESLGQATYLTPRNIQRERFIRAGYTEAPGDYGLVKKAVGNRNIPVYQKRPDDEKRENLIPIGNIPNHWAGQENARLMHPGGFPTAIYINPETSELYQKAWDLNDYGGGTGAYNKYNLIEKVSADLIDKIGSPVVVTSGISKIDANNYDDQYVRKVTDSFMKTKGLHRYTDTITDTYPAKTMDGKPLMDINGKQVYWHEKHPFTYYGLPEVKVIAKKKK